MSRELQTKQEQQQQTPAEEFESKIDSRQDLEPQALQQEALHFQPAKDAMKNKLAEDPDNAPYVTTTTTTTRTTRTNVTSTATSNPFFETYTTTTTVQKK